MILIFRKYIVRALLFLSFLSLLIMLFWIWRHPIGEIKALWDYEQAWWTIRMPSSKNILFKIIAIGGQLLFSCFSGLLLFRQIKRNPSAELSFFYLFLFSFTLQLFRLPQFSEYISFVFSGSNLFTRIIYFSRILALSSLFAASIFSSGLQIQKFGMVLLISLLTAFTLATLIPINNSILTGSLLNRVAREKYLALFCLTLESLTVLNYISSGHQQGRSEYYRLAILSLVIICGYELLFFLHIPFILPGFICLVSGSILFTRTSRKLFLWS